MRIGERLLTMIARSGWTATARAVVRGLAKCGIKAPPWCLKKILFADLKRYRTPEARATIALASDLYAIEPRQAAELLECEQINGLLEVAIPHVIGMARDTERDSYDSTASASIPPLKYDHILIFAYGRTGSTLLTGLLNAIPGVLVRGENNNATYYLYKFFDALSRTHNQHKKATSTKHPWFGAAELKLSYMLAELKRVATEMLLGQVEYRENIRCLGFKEIRFLEAAEHFDDYIVFLQMLFPNALFIVNRRDHAEVAKSGFWSDMETDAVMSRLQQTDQLFDKLHRLHPHVFEINYSELTSGSARIRELYEVIGAPYSPEEVSSVLGQVHSYAPRQKRVRDLSRWLK